MHTHTHSEGRGGFVQRAIVLLPLVDSIMRERTGTGSKILSSVLANLNTIELQPIGGKMCRIEKCSTKDQNYSFTISGLEWSHYKQG